jgi:hypothetical protein
VLALAGVGLLGLPAVSAAEPRVTLSPAAGPPGTSASLQGSGFRKGARVTVKAAGKTLARARARGAGTFKATLDIPDRRGRSLELVSRSRSGRVSNVFRYARAGAADSVEIALSGGGRLRWSASSGPPGTTLKLEGSRLARNRSVRVSFDGKQLSTARSDGRGRLRHSIKIPGVPFGAHRVAVRVRHTRFAFAFTVAADPIVAAAGDIACDPGSSSFNGGFGSSGSCRQRQTSDLLLGLEPAAVLALGDLQYEDATLSKFRASYDASWGRLKAITYPAVGNHEYLTSDASAYFDYFNGAGKASGAAGDRTKGYYGFDLGSWHLVSLNSNCSQAEGCDAGSAQERWLRADLAAHPRSCTLAYWHHPRFASGQYADNSELAPFWKALYDYRAELVLNGHDHNYQRYAPQDPAGKADPNGLREFVVGTGGKNHTGVDASPIPNREAANDDTYGALVLTLHPRSYEWQFRSEAGAVVDSGSGNCR